MQKRPVAPAASRRERHERLVVRLLSEREALMNEIALRARVGTLPPMLAKARTLLTRFWAKANWEARSEILAAARMLLTLGAAQPALRPPRIIAPAKRAAPPAERTAPQPAASPAAPGRRKAPATRKITEEAG